MNGTGRPWRGVTGSALHSGRGSLLGGGTARRTRWWVLDLECGHKTERTVRYRRLPAGEAQRGGTQHRNADDVLPAPENVRCWRCR